MLCAQLLSVSSPAGPVASGVTQTPRYLIKTRGQKVMLRCFPVSGHLSVYWYQQVLGQGPRFLTQYYNREERDKGDILERFSAQQFPNYSSQLDLDLLELEDSALYLCASSEHSPARSAAYCTKILPPTPRSGSDGKRGSASPSGPGPGKADGPLPNAHAAAYVWGTA